MNIKLPSLTLPIFSGQYSQWLLFKDSFTSAINNNQSITDVQRFQYLRSSLKNEALHVIEALETSGENYKIAWDLLEAQYQNRRLIVNTHLKEIIEIPSVTKDNRASLGQFVNHIRKHVRALESLKLPVKQWDTILIYLATSKLDFFTRREWENNVGVRTIETLPTLEEFLKFLADKCHMLEMIDRDKNRSNDSKPTNNHAKKSENRVALATTVQYACWFCKGAHSIFFCSKLLKLPVPVRVQEIKKLHLCLNCLRKGHISKDCKASGCKHCSQQHNSILHPEQHETHQSTAQKEAQPEKASSTVCAKVTKPCASQILLSTVQVDAYDASGKVHQCRALLDPGSQSNIITKQLAKKLRLPVKSINLPIVGINQCRTNINQSTRVAIKSHYDQSIDEIECLILPVITEMIPQVQVNSSIMKIPQHLQLADETYHMPGSVDLLIGAGLFWQSLKP